MKTVKTEKKIKVSGLAEFDMTRHLKSKRAMTEYLNQVISDGDDAELAAAIRDGAFDANLVDVLNRLRPVVEDKVRVANPRYLL